MYLSIEKKLAIGNGIITVMPNSYTEARTEVRYEKGYTEGRNYKLV